MLSIPFYLKASTKIITIVIICLGKFNATLKLHSRFKSNSFFTGG